MTFTVRDVAEWVQGEVVGDPARIIRAAKPLSDSPGADEITVVLDEKYLSQFHASAGRGRRRRSVRPAQRQDAGPGQGPAHGVRHHRPEAARQARRRAGSGSTRRRSSTRRRRSARTRSVGPHVSVGEGSVIGARCRLAAGRDHRPPLPARRRRERSARNVVVYDGCVLGNRVIIHANAVIGPTASATAVQGRHVKVPQLGSVEIGDDVEIGACTTIDRGTFGTTRIGAGTKIDNLVQIAHNCQIGRHNLFAAQVGIAGLGTTGDYVVMAGQVGRRRPLPDRRPDACSGRRAASTSDIPADQKMLGAPATPVAEQLRIMIEPGEAAGDAQGRPRDQEAPRAG